MLHVIHIECIYGLKNLHKCRLRDCLVLCSHTITDKSVEKQKKF